MAFVSVRMLVVSALMLVAAGLGWAMKPTQKVADEKPGVNLENMIPKQFGNWIVDSTVVPIAPSPDVQGKLNKIYNQTLSRTYVNQRGQRVMLSIAYGGDQGDAMQVHRPEVCYAAQGFAIERESFGGLLTDQGALPIKRLIATQGSRHEPITYWITIGDEVIRAGFQQKLAQLKYGLTGRVPDGVLVRVSSIDPDAQRAYEIQGTFLRAMLDALVQADRVTIAGRIKK